MYARKVIEKNLKNEVSLLLLYMGNFFFKNDMPTQMPALTVDKSVSTEQNLEIDSIKKFVRKILTHEDIENKVYERLVTMLIESIENTKIELEDYIINISVTSKKPIDEFVVKY